MYEDIITCVYISPMTTAEWLLPALHQYVCVCMYVYLYIYMHIYMFENIKIYAYTRMYINTHISVC